jgi:hypothetical protein
MPATCIAAIRICSKCGKPAGLRGMGEGIIATKYCGDGSDKDNEHRYNETITVTIPWPIPDIVQAWSQYGSK